MSASSSSSSTQNQQLQIKEEGNNLFQQGKHKEAIEVYTKAIDIDPFNEETAPALYSNRAACYNALNQFREAFEDAGVCCGLKPEWAKGWARRGLSAMKLQKWKISVESFDKYLELDPSDEMKMQAHRDSVKETVDEMERVEQRRLAAIESKKKEISSMNPGPNRSEKAANLVIFAAQCFDIEAMKFGFNHGARLDRFPKPRDAPYETFFEGLMMPHLLKLRGKSNLDSNEDARREYVKNTVDMFEALLDEWATRPCQVSPAQAFIMMSSFFITNQKKLPTLLDFTLLLIQKGIVLFNGGGNNNNNNKKKSSSSSKITEPQFLTYIIYAVLLGIWQEESEELRSSIFSSQKSSRTR